MKKAGGWFAVFALLLALAGAAFAQTSDYEVIQSFKNRHQALLEAVKSVHERDRRDLLAGEIGSLEAEYRQHEKLLAEGLYPSTFAAAMATLREQLQKSTERIQLAEESRKDKATIVEITKQAEETTKKLVQTAAERDEYRASTERLTREVAELNERFKKLSEENAGLLATIKALQAESRKDKESIARLKELTEKLSANIRDRDELIVKMMDSLFDEYSKANLTDAQKKNLLSIAQQNDYVSKIVTTIDGNISYVGAAQLAPQDVKVLRDQQKQLATKWEGIKPFVSKLYPDEATRARDITTVDGRLADLKKGTSDAVWRSLRQVFTANGISVAPFASGAELHASLLKYLDEQVQAPSRDTYRLFRSKVWDSPIKDQWLPVIPTDELTERQRGEIEARIALWDRKITAQLWRWVLIGALCVAALAVVAALVLRKKKPTEAG